MKKRVRQAKGLVPKPRRLRLPAIIVAVAMVAIGAVTVISRQLVKVKEKAAVQLNKTQHATAANKNYITMKVAGREVQVDSQTGQIKELTPEEAARLAAGLHELVNQSMDGLEQEYQADGSVKMDLKGHFGNVTVARENEDGSTSVSCVDNPKAAGAFFGIDPQQIENPTAPHQSGSERQRLTPAEHSNQ